MERFCVERQLPDGRRLRYYLLESEERRLYGVGVGLGTPHRPMEREEVLFTRQKGRALRALGLLSQHLVTPATMLGVLDDWSGELPPEP